MLEGAVKHHNRLPNLFQQLLSVARIPSFPLSNPVVSSILLVLSLRSFRQVAVYQETGRIQTHNFLLQQTVKGALFEYVR